MSERFQKTFISVTEFVESWDKELYELNNLDYFTYLMINHLGNQLDKRFFTGEKRESELFLDFERIGTLCFNLGDSFEYFLEENCLGSCPANCPRDLNGKIEFRKLKAEDKIKDKLTLLQSFMDGDLDKEQALRIDLMNNVIVDTLIHFYDDEFGLTLDEKNFSLIELAEFVEENMIDFIRQEGQTLLHKPFETAVVRFEDLLQSEADEDSSGEWQEKGDVWEKEDSVEEWKRKKEPISKVVQSFISDERYNPGHSSAPLLHDISFFVRYLEEYAGIEDIYQLDEHHLGEFFSLWLTREFIMGDEKNLTHIFRATARFITYLFHHYRINLKKEFLYYYDALKLDLPRTIQAMNTFISEYNLLEAILAGDDAGENQKEGFFEIIEIHDRNSRLLDVREIHFLEHLHQIKLDSSAFSKLRKGDLLHASLIKPEGQWEIIDLQCIYPNLCKRYIHVK